MPVHAPWTPKAGATSHGAYATHAYDAGVQDPHAATRDGISLAPILSGDTNVLENPDSHRVGILVEKPVTSGGID